MSYFRFIINLIKNNILKKALIKMFKKKLNFLFKL
jgi:hypothetical protein